MLKPELLVDLPCDTGEGPLWHPQRGQFFWFDILNQRLLSQDNGAPMPDETLPAPKQVSTDVALEDLPEGGFGWFLIHNVTKDLSYRREEGWNYLNFSVPATP